MSTSYISSEAQSVERVASVSPYTRGLRSHFRFRGSTLPALLTLIKNKKRAENVGKNKKKIGVARGEINKKLILEMKISSPEISRIEEW